MVPLLVARVNETQTCPAPYDVLTHEHDVRAALELRGARHHESIERFSHREGGPVTQNGPKFGAPVVCAAAS